LLAAQLVRIASLDEATRPAVIIVAGHPAIREIGDIGFLKGHHRPHSRRQPHRDREWPNYFIRKWPLGEFGNSGGVFVDQEPFNDRVILVRNTFMDITPDSARFEQTFSE
jgi:hypothetical protein